MSTRTPLSTISLSGGHAARPLFYDDKDEESWNADRTPTDENNAPLDPASGDTEGAIEVGAHTLSPSEAFSHRAISAPEASSDESSDDETYPDGEDEKGSDDDDDTMRRFLAFANRNRASGSSLPAILAQLNRAVEEADDGDSETAKLFVSCVAGVIRQERQIQTAVAEILEDDQLTVESPTTSEEGFPFCGRCATTRDSEEQRVFEAWLTRRAAFEELGVTRLDGADTEGFTLAQLEQRGKAPAKPLRRKLLKYLCEVDVYDECTYHGLRYPKPCAPHVKPDIRQSSRAYVVESGTIGNKTPQMHI
ncbi:hypothetical protein TRAPUB_5752 [Trametes pubescens]|uniref:Uncharacterized protein n=1 Tax=Trametes pubescens TaxID=154538 RepID=A0A1M2V7T7_TRAPU|nr:hypothetical protein TRAPUB_5752 [Trametes pubescens]